MPKEKLKEQIINELNKALEVEYSAIIMYLHHAEFVTGLNAEPIIERLKDSKRRGKAQGYDKGKNCCFRWHSFNKSE